MPQAGWFRSSAGPGHAVHDPVVSAAQGAVAADKALAEALAEAKRVVTLRRREQRSESEREAP
jgi:hypothetical protein